MVHPGLDEVGVIPGAHHRRSPKKIGGTRANVQTRGAWYIQMLAVCLEGKSQGQHMQLTGRPGVKPGSICPCTGHPETSGNSSHSVPPRADTSPARAPHILPPLSTRYPQPFRPCSHQDSSDKVLLLSHLSWVPSPAIRHGF